MATGDADLVWRLMSEISHCMLIYHDGKAMRARPMSGSVDREKNAVWFLVGAGLRDDLEKTDGKVCLSFVDDVQSVFLSVSGSSEFSSDAELTAEVRGKVSQRWHGELAHETAEIGTLRVTPVIAEYWRHPTTELMIALDALTSGATHMVDGAAGVTGRVDLTV